MIYTNTSILTAIVCALSILSVFVDGQINLRHGNGRVFAEILAASKGRSLEEEMIEDVSRLSNVVIPPHLLF